MDFASELESIGRELRRQGDGELRRELDAAFRDAVNPALPAIREGLRPHMPDPYADKLNADLALRVSVITAGSEPGVSVVASARSKKRKLARLESGLLTAPLPRNDREHWYTQGLPHMVPGFFTGPCRAREPEVVAGLEKALQAVADEVDRRAAGA